MSRALFSDVTPSEYNIMSLEDKTSGLPCLRDLYLNLTLEDPTEYYFATEVFNTWDFWENLSSSAVIRPVVDKWRTENMIRQKSLAVKQLKMEATMGKSKATAAKWLFDNGFTAPKPKKKEAEKVNKKIDSSTERDMERLGLKVIE
jgi:hypothetical protein